VTRANMGFPHFVSVVVAYSSPKDLPSDDHLIRRIDELQEHFPLLYAALRGTKTRGPFFQQGETHWSKDRIIRRMQYSATGNDGAKVLQDEMKRLDKLHLESDPLWQVALYTASDDSPAYLVVSGHHALTDGKAVFNLTDALLAADISHLPYEQVDKVPLLSDTHDLRPGLLYILGLIWTALLVPKLPARIQPYLRPAHAWPDTGIRRPASKCEGRFSLLELPHSLIDSLKVAGRQNGVKTLHPILTISYATAIWHVMRGSSDSLVIRASTPSNIRDLSLGHGYCTGNYVGSAPVTFVPRPETDFWAETAQVAIDMSSKASKKRALELMGALSYVPDPAPDLAKRDTDRPTGWEQFFGETMESAVPYSDTMSISNIGRVKLPPKAADLFWAQGASPMAPPFTINVVGHEKGLRVTPTWRDGAVVDEDDVKRVDEVWERILNRLANPLWKGRTLQELTQERI